MKNPLQEYIDKNNLNHTILALYLGVTRRTIYNLTQHPPKTGSRAKTLVMIHERTGINLNKLIKYYGKGKK